MVNVLFDLGNPCNGYYSSGTGNYWASWEINPTTNVIKFQVAAQLSATEAQWLAIGMNTERKMASIHQYFF